MAPAVFVQTAPAQTASDWPSYNRDLASTRYSALKQINTGNVGKLAQAWSYRLRPDANSPAAGTMNEVTPIVVNGVMYLPAGNRVVALDPETGAEVWRYELKSGAASQRGVSYWPGDKENPPRILFLAGHKMVALNAKTGKIDPGFGNEGELTMDVPFAGVPTIYKNVILVGMNMFGPGEEHAHQQDELPGGMPGDSRAYDVRTGKKLWDFHAVPLPGEVGHDDWKEGNWKRSGNNMWSYAITVDEKRGIVYMPMGGPAANYYGGDRKGNNLFANSVVAVDYQTGKLKWYFQTVHHELWDYDLPPDPVLIDIVKDGKKIPALVQRKSGKHVYSGSPDWQAGVRRGGATGSARERAGRMVCEDSAVSIEASAAGAHQHLARRYRNGRRHLRRSCQSLSGALGQAGLSGRGAFCTVGLPGRRHAAARDHQYARAHRRDQLGRSDGGSGDGLRFCKFAGQSRNRLADE